MVHLGSHTKITSNPQELIHQVRQRLNGAGLADDWGDLNPDGNTKGSAVLFLLTLKQVHADAPPEPCVLLNKRSRKVLQPGDLCCPGGGVQRLDKVLASVAQWPLLPLTRWPLWSQWRTDHSHKAKGLALLFTTALREAFEEMRLNPLRVEFLGPMAVQPLIMFERVIYPLAAWVPPHQTLKPNWEVERIVHIPLTRLLDPANYARFRLTFDKAKGQVHRKEDLPCFIHRRRNGHEVLWGATFRITLDFMKQVFDFNLPDLTHTPIHFRDLSKTYLNGSLMSQTGYNPPGTEGDY